MPNMDLHLKPGLGGLLVAVHTVLVLDCIHLQVQRPAPGIVAVVDIDCIARGAAAGDLHRFYSFLPVILFSWDSSSKRH